MNQSRRILFVCIHNSGRSQMAEAFLNDLGGPEFVAESAGVTPRPINPEVVQVMQELGYDLSGAESDSIFDFFREGRLYEQVIYVCEREAEEDCPVFPGVRRILHWPFPDPATLPGSEAERLEALRGIRDQIRSRVEEWLQTDRS
ncbi:arsenate reductase ArsC [Guyparkeria halophila]|uniref:Arsenate reductase ArsC n=1 Tax=Guyparkeria halophila TaxID=47960 RepID=A0ABZ0YX11_9GAMM|nr:arsenate reductase ArsC [Guyparkeria halophila]WQH16694.1 arsenate reductase ArsC [Guyparkeria halophila]